MNLDNTTAYVIYQPVYSSETSIKVQEPCKRTRLQNTISAEKSSTQVKNANNLINILKSVSPDDVAPETADFWYFKRLNKAKYTDFYNHFLSEVAKQDNMAKIATLVYLAHQPHVSITMTEENFVLGVLRQDDVKLQSFALDTILNWDDFSRKELLTNINIKNKYLAEDLKDFINEA